MAATKEGGEVGSCKEVIVRRRRMMLRRRILARRTTMARSGAMKGWATDKDNSAGEQR